MSHTASRIGGRISRIPHRIRGLLLLLVLTFTGACGVEYPQSTISPASDFADVIHSLYTSIFWWTVLIGGVVWLLMGYILLRFRERPGGDEPSTTRGHMGLEVGWTVGPALIVVAIAIPTVQAVFATQQAPPDEEGALVVDVVGHQFWWEFRYPDSGIVTANELHLPVGTPVSLRLRSADVIHSFWVPVLGGKRDVNPEVEVAEGEDSRYTFLHFTPSQTGVFMGQCAEFCGAAHSLMGMRVVVEANEDFEAWQQEWLNPSYSEAQWPAASAGPAGDGAEQDAAETADAVAASAEQTGEASGDEELIAQGRRVFFEESYCVLCHAVNGTSAAGDLGPNLTGFGDRRILAGILENTPENLEAWIREPAAIKPGVRMPGAQTAAPREQGGEWQPTDLDDDQVRAVAAYLSSLTGS